MDDTSQNVPIQAILTLLRYTTAHPDYTMTVGTIITLMNLIQDQLAKINIQHIDMQRRIDMLASFAVS